MTTRTAALRFILSPDGNDINVYVTRTVPVTDTKPLAVMRRKHLEEARNELADFLFEVQAEVGDELVIKDCRRLAQPFERLRKRSRELQSLLLGGTLDLIPTLRKRCETALLPARRQGRFAVIEISGPEDLSFPFEFIANLELDRWPRLIKDKADVFQACRSFLGFAAVLRRDLLTTQDAGKPQKRRLHNLPKLPVALFVHSKLEATRGEHDYFAGLPRVFELRGPWAGSGDKDVDNIAHLVRTLYESGAGPGAAPDQIQHFACHCQGDDNPLVRVTASREQEVTLQLGVLQEEFAKILEVNEPREFELPLVFMNACSSGEHTRGSAWSFPEFFLNNRYRGFIGTETTVPDALAGELAQEFYYRLLRGDSVGVALQRAKLAMVTRYNNPLGILYTLYADPDLKVQQGRKHKELVAARNDERTDSLKA